MDRDVGALTPFMQLHGRANLAPWTVPDHEDETVALYSYWAKLHHAIVPFFYSLAEEAWKKGNGIIAPAGDDVDRRLSLPARRRVPRRAASLDATGKRDVQLPAGRWYDWWTGEATDGGKTFASTSPPIARSCRFSCTRARSSRSTWSTTRNALGTKASKGARTIAIWPTMTSTFPLHDEDDAVTTVQAELHEMGDVKVTLSRATKATILRVRMDAAVTKATLNGTALTVVTTRDAFDAAPSALFVDGPPPRLGERSRPRRPRRRSRSVLIDG